MDIHEAQRMFDRLVRTNGLPADRASTHSGLTHIHVTISPRLRTAATKVLMRPADHRGKVEIRVSETYVSQSEPHVVRKAVLAEIKQVIRANPKWLTLKPAGTGVGSVTKWQKAMLTAGVPPRVAQKLIDATLKRTPRKRLTPIAR